MPRFTANIEGGQRIEIEAETTFIEVVNFDLTTRKVPAGASAHTAEGWPVLKLHGCDQFVVWLPTGEEVVFDCPKMAQWAESVFVAW